MAKLSTMVIWSPEADGTRSPRARRRGRGGVASGVAGGGSARLARCGRSWVDGGGVTRASRSHESAASSAARFSGEKRSATAVHAAQVAATCAENEIWDTAAWSEGRNTRSRIVILQLAPRFLFPPRRRRRGSV